MGENILICGPNWLGDGIMSMPAVIAYREKNPSSRITLLVKQSMRPLWEMLNVVDDIIVIEDGLAGTMNTAEKINRKCFDRSFVFPNSFRSAFLPFLAGVRERIGARGHHRSFMLSRFVAFSNEVNASHQLMEYLEIMGLDRGDGLVSLPLLEIDQITDANVSQFTCKMETIKKTVAIMPGAAYGESKRWPSEYFVDLGRKLAGKYNMMVLGSADESGLCSDIARNIGDAVLCVAGRTSLKESAALLKSCDVVVCNDSGGMHLAAAVGTKVVAIYGITDSVKTGPIGEGHRLILPDGVQGNRDIPRESTEATAALRSIPSDRVYKAVIELLK